MGITAETLGAQYAIKRGDCDAFALASQQRWVAATKAGALAPTIAPMDLPGRKGAVETFASDENPRPDTSAEILARLPAVFKKDDGLVSAGNASGICDGAAALVLANEVGVKGRKPLARVVAWATAGVDPKIMGIGPVPAIQAVLKRAGLQLKDMDMIEVSGGACRLKALATVSPPLTPRTQPPCFYVSPLPLPLSLPFFQVNEAFAAQVLAVSKELALPHDKLNVYGGAIALGHPLGASGARILGLLAHSLAAGKGRYALGSACIGGGQGMAVILERV
jgi:acetyl-CoA acyltransferase 2